MPKPMLESSQILIDYSNWKVVIPAKAGIYYRNKISFVDL